MATVNYVPRYRDQSIRAYSADELRKLYESLGVTPEKDVIVYCRIGERPSHTWFALKYLLGYDRVRNYDGGSTEWGNLVGVPVARGTE